MLLWGFNFFCEGLFILPSYTNVGVCEGKKVSSFAIFSIANVLAFLRWLDINHAYFVLSNLIISAKMSGREEKLSNRDLLCTKVVTTLPTKRYNLCSDSYNW